LGIIDKEMTYQIVSERKVRNASQIKNPDDIFNLLKRYAASKQEQIILITLNASHVPIRIILLSIGTVNRALVHMRDIFYYAIKDMAVAIMLCHNHPSGTLVPSREDIDITKSAVDTGNIMGIPVIEHLIINKKDYFSFKREGIINSDNKYVEPKPEDRNYWENKYKDL
jgi:DNA repair protein RadC